MKIVLQAPGCKPVAVDGRPLALKRGERIDPSNPNRLIVSYEYRIRGIHDVAARCGGEVTDDYQAPADMTVIGQPGSALREWDYPALMIVEVEFDYGAQQTTIRAEATVDRDRVGI